jgi:AcrR family transcriptional regulator
VSSTSVPRDGDTPRISGEMRKADLLEAATRIFAERGYDGASLQDIADSIGILKGSVYYYYKSKEDILFDIMKLVHDEHLENARSYLGTPGDPLQRLQVLLEGHAAFVCRNLDRTTVFLREMDRLPPQRQAEILGPDHAYQRVFRSLVIEAQEAGQIAPGVNPKLAALWILGSLNWLHRWYRPDRSTGPQDVPAQIASQLTRGIAASPLWDRLG